MNQADSIIERRKTRLMSQELLAQAAAVSVRTVARAEGGGRISPESLKALCAVLDLDPLSWDAAPVPRGVLRVVGHADDSDTRRDNLSDIEAFVRASLPDASLLTSTHMTAWRNANYRNAPHPPGERHFKKLAERCRAISWIAVILYPWAYLLIVVFVVMPVWQDHHPGALPTPLLWGALALMPVLLFTVPFGVLTWRLAIREDRHLRTAFAFDPGHLHEVTLTRNLVTVVTTPLVHLSRGERRVTRHGTCYRFTTKQGKRIAMPFLPDDPWLHDLLSPLFTSSSVLHERTISEYRAAAHRLRPDELMGKKESNPSYGIF